MHKQQPRMIGDPTSFLAKAYDEAGRRARERDEERERQARAAVRARTQDPVEAQRCVKEALEKRLRRIAKRTDRPIDEVAQSLMERDDRDVLGIRL